jgi:hypothetical protein
MKEIKFVKKSLYTVKIMKYNPLTNYTKKIVTLELYVS